MCVHLLSKGRLLRLLHFFSTCKNLWEPHDLGMAEAQQGESLIGTV